MFCNNCGHKNPVGANFCSSCGELLIHEDEDDTTVKFAITDSSFQGEEDFEINLSNIEEDEALLVVKRGPNSGETFLLNKEKTTIGRHPESDIYLDDITVSRRHVEIIKENDSFRVRDFGSLNGTFVNRERVEEAILKNGDELQVGKFKLVFISKKTGS